MHNKKHINGISEYQYKLSNRENTFHELNRSLMLLRESMVNNCQQRDQFSLPMIAGFSGSGKTVVLQQPSNYLQDIPVSITCHVDFELVSVTESEKLLSASTVLALRLLFSIFLCGNSFIFYGDFVEQLLKLSGTIIELSTAFDIVETIYRQITMKRIKYRTGSTSNWAVNIAPSDEEYLTIVLGIDSCHEFNLTQNRKEKTDLLSTPLDDICDDLSQLTYDMW